jgi:alkanesulfonate monooxygenase SsuD/methylene tetrahydromethanopterin reductase-like flavin-dependent oxidoreductase (luciferase family)
MTSRRVHPVRFGLLVPTLMEFEPCGLDRLREAAAIGDDYGFEVLWVGDHLMFSSPILESTVSVAILGSLTSRVSVGTNVLQLPLRRPLDVAKSYATISHLTGGRVVLGIGVGGEFETEWQAAGVDRRQRGARCDEAIDTLLHLWEGCEAKGRFASSPAMAIDPPPAGGRVPLWVGGRVEAAVRRAARCNGSLSMWVSPRRCTEIRDQITELRSGDIDEFTFGLELLAHIDDDLGRARTHIHEAVSRLHLDPDRIERYTAYGPPERVAEHVMEYVRAGVTHISFYLPGVGWSEQAMRVATEVLPLITAAHHQRVTA